LDIKNLEFGWLVQRHEKNKYDEKEIKGKYGATKRVIR